MNVVIWSAQILLAGTFLFTGLTKLFACHRLLKALEYRPQQSQVGISHAQAIPIGLMEIAGAIGVILPGGLMPATLAPDYLLNRVAASGLALLMVAAGLYHFARREPAEPAVTACWPVFVIVGRWPH